MKRECSILAGVAALPIITFTTALFGHLEPGYSHLEHSVSSLGAYTAEHTFLMNLFGLLLPGALVSWSFLMAANSPISSAVPRSVMHLMIIFGLTFSALAMPMDMGPIPFTGVTVHYICAYASVMFFLSAAIISAFNYRRITSKAFLSSFLVVLPIVFIGIRVFSKLGLAPGLAQRGLLLCIFTWVAVMCFILYWEKTIER